MRSPIEKKLSDELLRVESRYQPATLGDNALASVGDSIELQTKTGGRFDLWGWLLDNGSIAIVVHDAEFLGYRLDILIMDSRVALGVECDGHDWHERTKQQASYDRARDREMLKAGLPVIRFTGSDIHRDAEQCALECRELFSHLQRSWWQRYVDFGKEGVDAYLRRQAYEMRSEMGTSAGLVF